MKREEERIVLEGHTLQRYLYLPEERARATAVLFHGQGDYIGRYEAILPLFLERGIAVIGADLPGHGKSPGRRGHVPGLSLVNTLTASHRARLDALGIPGPRGILGHSCGGLLALYTILQDPAHWNFSWLSSPLIKPEASQTPLKAALFLLAARIAPWLSVSTGVGEDACLSQGHVRSRQANDLFHSRMNLSWAREIQETAQRVRQSFREKPTTAPLLITQGSDDPICPPEHIRALVQSAPDAPIYYHEFPGLRHEPFADEKSAFLLQALADFLDTTVSSLPHQDKARGT